MFSEKSVHSFKSYYRKHTHAYIHTFDMISLSFVREETRLKNKMELHWIIEA